MTFEAFPKISRYDAETFTITEKIDGSNAAIRIEFDDPDNYVVTEIQSRKRLIEPGSKTDNAGFAGWVRDNEHELANLLGPGMHYGEWWGAGVQRRYGQETKRFSLFNSHRWSYLRFDEHRTVIDGVPVDSVPVLAQGQLSDLEFELIGVHATLERKGSFAAPGFMNPEGCMIYLHRSGTYLKAPLDTAHKGGVRDVDGNRIVELAA